MALLLTLLAGAVVAVAADKAVTLVVDGRERTVHTYAADVLGAVRDAGLNPTARDRLEPAGSTRLEDGDHIILRRARPLTVVEGGFSRKVWTTAASVSEALRGMGVRARATEMSAAPGAAIPLDGMRLSLSVSREITLVDGAKPPRTVTTTAGSVEALLDEQGVPLGSEDFVVPAPSEPLRDGDRVQVLRDGGGQITETVRIPPSVTEVPDPTMAEGEKEIVRPGRAGELLAVYRVRFGDGEVRREKIRGGVLRQPKPRLVRVGTQPGVVAPEVGFGTVWDRLAQCESTGNWDTNTGNGYYGGLQFDRTTWQSYGGGEYASMPHQASREEQIAVAKKVREDRGGYQSWPACARKLDLPREGTQ